MAEENVRAAISASRSIEFPGSTAVDLAERNAVSTMSGLSEAYQNKYIIESAALSTIYAYCPTNSIEAQSLSNVCNYVVLISSG